MTREQAQANEDNWKYRRTMAFGSVAALIAMLGYLTVFATGGNVVQQMLAQAIPFGIVGIVFTYVGGAVADDAFQMRLNKA